MHQNALVRFEVPWQLRGTRDTRVASGPNYPGQYSVFVERALVINELEDKVLGHQLSQSKLYHTLGCRALMWPYDVREVTN